MKNKKKHFSFHCKPLAVNSACTELPLQSLEILPAMEREQEVLQTGVCYLTHILPGLPIGLSSHLTEECHMLIILTYPNANL